MKKSITLRTFIICLIFALAKSYGLNGQNGEKQSTVKTPFLDFNKDKVLKPFLAVETWATYSMGEKKGETQYADRGDISIRRLRFGATGSPYSWLQYHFQMNVDRLGQDPYASTKGSYSGVSIWDAYLTAKLIKNSDLLYLHAGYYWAAISREYNTSCWSQATFDRTRANWFMRRFISGRGNGCENGFGFGGLKNYNNFGFSYRIGTFEPAAYASSKYASRLYTGHVLFSFGDPEQTKYKFRLSGNQWRKRKGVTLGFGGSTQSDGQLSETLYFDSSLAFGTDLIINLNGLRIDGEYYKFKRTASGLNDFDGTQWHIKASYNFIASNKYLEPVIAYDKYEGEGEQALYNYIGDDKTLDIGINWYLNKDKVKLALHYVVQDGSVSSKVGDYFGLAFQIRL